MRHGNLVWLTTMGTQDLSWLTPDLLRSVLRYAKTTGIFMWRRRADMPRKWNSKWAGKRAGTKGYYGYIYIQILGSNPLPAHRLAWLYVHGTLPAGPLDHRNGDRADNRIANLRVTDATGNAINKAMQRNNTSGYVGVHFDTQRRLWRARVNYRRVMHDVGFFRSAKEAALARAEFVREIHGEFSPENPGRARYRHHRDP